MSMKNFVKLFVLIFLLINFSFCTSFNSVMVQDDIEINRLQDSIIVSIISEMQSGNNSTLVDPILMFREDDYWKKRVDTYMTLTSCTDYCKPINKHKYFGKNNFVIPNSLKRVSYYTNQDISKVFAKDTYNLFMFTPIYKGIDNKFHLICHYYITYKQMEGKDLFLYRLNSIKVLDIIKIKGKFICVNKFDYCDCKDSFGCNISGTSLSK